MQKRSRRPEGVRRWDLETTRRKQHSGVIPTGEQALTETNLLMFICPSLQNRFFSGPKVIIYWLFFRLFFRFFTDYFIETDPPKPIFYWLLSGIWKIGRPTKTDYLLIILKNSKMEKWFFTDYYLLKNRLFLTSQKKAGQKANSACGAQNEFWSLVTQKSPCWGSFGDTTLLPRWSREA